MRQILRKLNVLLDKKQKRTMAGLMVMMVVSAFLQTAGVGLMVQVIDLVVDPEKVQNSRMAKWFYEFLGSNDYRSFSITVMVLLIFTFVAKNIFLFLQQKATFSFVYTNQFRTSERMMRNYIRRDYEFFLNADTAVVQRSITSDVNNMYDLILALLQLLSDGVVSFFVIAYCLMKSGTLTIIMAVVLLILMAVIKKMLKPVIYRAGKDNREYYSGLFKWISQTIQGIKEIKIACREPYFVEEYKKCGKGYVDAVQKNSLYSNIPKLLIETVCIMTMVGYMIFLSVSGVSTENMLDAFSTLAAAALILLPCVNRINNQINRITYTEPFFMGVSDNLQDEISGKNVDMSCFSEDDEKLPIRDSIELKGITYAYPGTTKLIFDHADLKIPIGSSVGIVGTTGAGKSTIVDILLGLLKVSAGEILADGKKIGDNYRNFLQNIGYIPQMIFMLDDSIRKNVAFGVPEDKIDDRRIWEVLKEAQLDEFVRSLPEGLNTCIGERGIRVSGGQRQRISIARALYHDPEVLILDEATSAVDNETEAAIMDAVNRMHGRKTLIIIAHRLQTIEKCDMVYRVNDGKILAEMTKMK